MNIVCYSCRLHKKPLGKQLCLQLNYNSSTRKYIQLYIQLYSKKKKICYLLDSRVRKSLMTNNFRKQENLSYRTKIQPGPI